MIRLNLLPPEIKNELEYSKKNARIYQYLVKSLAVIVILITGLGLIWYVVWNNENVNQEQQNAAQAEVDQWKKTESDAKDFASRLNLIDKLQKDRLNWAKIFQQISASTPAGIRLTNIDFNKAETDRISISGEALDKTNVSSFRELLTKSPVFQYVDIETIREGRDPLKDITVQNFTISLTLKSAEAKK